MADSSRDAQKYWWLKEQKIGIGWLNTASDTDSQTYYKLDAVTRALTVKVHYKSKLTKISLTASAPIPALNESSPNSSCAFIKASSVSN